MGIKLLNQKELAKELNVDVKTLRRNFIYQSGFPYTVVGKTRRYRLDKVLEWLDKTQKYA